MTNHDPTADLAATLIGGHLALLELRQANRPEPAPYPAPLIDHLHDALCRSLQACPCKAPRLCYSCAQGLEAIGRYEDERATGEPLEAFDAV